MEGNSSSQTCEQGNSSSRKARREENSMQPVPQGGRPCFVSTFMRNSISLQGRRLSPHKKLSKFRVFCSTFNSIKCLDFQDNDETGGFPALSLNSFRRSPQKSYSKGKRRDIVSAWMSLDGLLVNADAAFSSPVPNSLDYQEAIAWNGFAPLQKVLLVAVTAVAASTARQRHLKDMRSLQLAIEKRDNDSVILQQKIEQLQKHLSFWKEHAQANRGGLKEIEGTGKLVINEADSPVCNIGLESTPKCASVMLEQFTTPQLGRVLDPMSHFQRTRRSACFKRKKLEGFTSKEKGNMGFPEDNNDKLSFLDRLSELSSVSEQKQKSEALTPKLPLTQLNKMFTPQLNMARVSLKQGDHLSRYCQKGCRRVDGSVDSLLLPDSMVILQLKEMVKHLIDIESPEMVVTLASVKDKAQILEISTSIESRSSTPLSPDKIRALDSLKDSIDQASANFARVKSNIVNLWTLLVSNASDVAFCQPDESEIFPTGKQCRRCKELETSLKAMREMEKEFMACKVACNTKDQKVARLEEEIGILQETVSELRSIHENPTGIEQKDQGSLQTFVTSNLLFNLDSPVKIESPQSARSSLYSWKGLDDVSRLSDSLDKESMRGSCDSDRYNLEKVFSPGQTDASKHIESGTTEQASRNIDAHHLRISGRSGTCRDEMIRKSSGSSSTDESGYAFGPVCQARLPEMPENVTSNSQTHSGRYKHGCTTLIERIGDNQTIQRHRAEESRKNYPAEMSGRSSTSRDEVIRKSSGSSSTDEGRYGCGPLLQDQLPQMRVSSFSKTKFTSADPKIPNGRTRPSTSAGTVHRKAEHGASSSKTCSVLTGVEPNTPLRERKCISSKDKIMSRSVDSVTRAKENSAHVKRWM